MRFKTIIIFSFCLFAITSAQQADAQQQTVTKVKVIKVEHGPALQQHGVCELQELLDEMGFALGGVDGLLANRTEKAMKDFYAKHPFQLELRASEGFLKHVRKIYNSISTDSLSRGESNRLPSNGYTFHNPDKNTIAPLQVITSDHGYHYFVKVSEQSTGAKIRTFFIRSGGTVNTEVPLGTYEIKYAAGKKWYSTRCLFGRNTIYNKADKTFTFSIQGNQISGYTVELILQPGGNLRTFKISPGDF